MVFLSREGDFDGRGAALSHELVHHEGGPGSGLSRLVGRNIELLDVVVVEGYRAGLWNGIQDAVEHLRALLSQ